MRVRVQVDVSGVTRVPEHNNLKKKKAIKCSHIMVDAVLT